MDRIKLTDLSLADLIALHGYGLLQTKYETHHKFLSDDQLLYVETAIKIKIGLIRFPSITDGLTIKKVSNV